MFYAANLNKSMNKNTLKHLKKKHNCWWLYCIWNKMHWIIFITGHPRLEPRSFPEEDIAASFDKDYMFMGCIKFIHQVIKENFWIYIILYSLCVLCLLEYSFELFLFIIYLSITIRKKGCVPVCVWRGGGGGCKAANWLLILII